MTKANINRVYVMRFILSMENDYKNWKMNHCAGPGMAWTEYHSPDYANEYGRVSFGFSLCHNGAWVDGYFKWNIPMWALYNPFTTTMWRFHKAERRMKSYLKSEEQRLYLEKLNQVI